MTPEEECRFILGAERFDHLTPSMDGLPTGVDRDAVYQAIADGVLARDAHQALDPERMRDQQEALERVGKAIAALKRKVPEAGGLEREYERLCNDWVALGMRREDVDFLSDEPPSDKGGRPRTPWSSVTRARLRAAGMSAAAADVLLEITGLKPTRR